MPPRIGVQRPVEDVRPAELLGFGAVAGGLDEYRKFLIGHRHRIDHEDRHIDDTNRRFRIIGPDLRIVAAHAKRACGNPDHAMQAHGGARRIA